MCNDAYTSSEEIPNHVIVWLDLNIGIRDDYKQLKAAFSSTTDPQHVSPVKLFDKNDDEIDRTVGFEQVNFEGVRFLLAAFTNIERCVKFLQENQDKRIFIITSGQMGKDLLRLITVKCKDIFIDPVTNEPYPFIYVYCHGIDRNQEWMCDYIDYLAPVFNFDADLLVRMVRDIADYFVDQSKRQMSSNIPDYSAAYNHLTWAHTLYDRYWKMLGDPIKKEFAEVSQLFDQATAGIKSSLPDD